MKSLWLSFVGGCVLLLSACATGPRPGDAPSVNPQAQAVEAYKIGVDDSVRVAVWQNPDLNVTVPVRPDGKISVPLVGDVEAGGKTPEEVSADIKTKLEAYVRNGSHMNQLFAVALLAGKSVWVRASETEHPAADEAEKAGGVAQRVHGGRDYLRTLPLAAGAAVLEAALAGALAVALPLLAAGAALADLPPAGWVLAATGLVMMPSSKVRSRPSSTPWWVVLPALIVWVSPGAMVYCMSSSSNQAK
jgi:hypothetical protein